MKWALIGAGVVIVALLFTVIAGGDKKTEKKPAPEVQPVSPAPGKPNSWSQDYATTFLYGSNVVTVDSVKVSGLKKKTATVSYLIKVRNNTGKIAWMKKRSSWALKGVGLSAGPQKMQLSNQGKTLRLTFSWPRKRLSYPGAALTMFIPGERETERVMLGLRVPSDPDKIRETDSQGVS